MEIGIDESINYLAGALPPIGAALNKLLGSDLDALSDGLQSVFEGLFDLITGGLMRAFQQPVRYLQAAIEEIFQMRDLKKSLDAGKTLDRDNLAGMTPDALDRRIHQLEGLMRKGGGTVQQQQFIQDQYQRATRFKEDPSQFVHGWESVQDIMDRNAKEQVRFGIGAGKTADEWEAGGKAQMALVGPQMAKAVEGISDTVKTLFSNLKRADVVDDTGARDKLAGLLRQLSNLGAAGVETSGPNGPLSAGGGAMKMDGDRLAKIGGFIGGGGGPALDFHRRTAVATEKTSAGVQSLLQRWTGGDKSSMTAVWA
jgi:hypothetical protein